MTIRGVTTMFMVLAFLAAGTVAWSAPPEGVGGGKGNSGQSKGGGQSKGKGQGGGQAPQSQDSSVSLTITVGDRTAVRNYYQAQFKKGSCPPGLAKKNNGCLPPGQSKKLWSVGRPLPPELVLYDVPASLLVKLTVPPAGYKYVRAAGDILLIAVGTSMVVDAIEDLGKL